MEATTLDEYLTGDDYKNIASLSGCSRDYVQKICKGEREVNSETSKKVYELGQKAYDLNVRKLVEMKKLAAQN